ncbi:hypothetical protein [Azospirillum sp.]|uniref:hypothetical protein n=1 Tax=Azospirillum sp. TaxID=34012 RepID=UPI002D351E11|nr:hypothetical protein [Azospirillum sp.]HYF86452.1 hypothetical protein [Azospirillum sp.]
MNKKGNERSQEEGRQKPICGRVSRGLGRGPIAATVGTCIMVACAPLQPMVHDSRLFGSTFEGQTTDQNGGAAQGSHPEIRLTGTLPAAIEAADAQRLAYLNAAAQYSALRNTTPLLAGALGATALFLGVTDTGSKTLAQGLGLGSVATLSGAAYYDNHPRQMVYISAAEAIGCLILAQRPLLMTQSDKADLDNGIENLRAALAELDSITPLYGQDDPSSQHIERIRGGAVANLEKAVKLRVALDTAGVVLRSHVLDVVGAADREIAKTDPNPAAVTTVLSGLVPGAGATFPGTAFDVFRGGFTGRSSANTPGLPDSLRRVAQAASRLGVHVERASAAAAIVKEMKACQPPRAEGELRIVPNEATVVMKPTDRRVYTVSGGTGLPQASIIGTYDAGTTAADTTLQNGVVTVVLTTRNANSAHQPILFISDAAGRTTREIRIQVQAGTDGQAGAGSNRASGGPDARSGASGSTDWSRPPMSFWELLTNEQRKMVRQTINAGDSSTPQWTTADDQALKAFAPMDNPTALNRDLYVRIREEAIRKLPAGERVADQLASDDVWRLKIRILCRVNKEGDPRPAEIFDSRLREVIFRFQERERGLPLDGYLDRATNERILKTGCRNQGG